LVEFSRLRNGLGKPNKTAIMVVFAGNTPTPKHF